MELSVINNGSKWCFAFCLMISCFTILLIWENFNFQSGMMYSYLRIWMYILHTAYFTFFMCQLHSLIWISVHEIYIHEPSVFWRAIYLLGIMIIYALPGLSALMLSQSTDIQILLSVYSPFNYIYLASIFLAGFIFQDAPQHMKEIHIANHYQFGTLKEIFKQVGKQAHFTYTGVVTYVVLTGIMILYW